MKWIAFLIVFYVPFCLFAQDQIKDSSELLPIEVKAIRASATAPFAKTNISKQEIEKSNLGQDLPFLLNQTPSMVVSSDAGNGVGYTYMHIRGSDATHINVTINGIPYNDGESELTYFVDLPDFVSSINSIQIQRGVGTSSNGAGTFGATINFSTNEVNMKPYLELNNSYGSFYTRKNTIKTGSGLFGKHFISDLRISHITSNGYIDRAFSNLSSIYFSTAYLSDHNEIRLNIITGKERTYQAWYGVSQLDLPIHRTINYAGTEKPGSPYMNQTDNYWQNHYQLFFTHKFNSNTSFHTALFYTKGYGYYEEYKSAQNYSDYHMPPVIEGSDTIFSTDLIRRLWLNNDFYGSTFSIINQGKKSQVTFGGAITQYNGDHYGQVIWAQHGITGNAIYYNVNAIKKDWNIYGKWKYDVSQSFQFFADMQMRSVNYLINGFEDQPSIMVHPIYFFINPKGGISYNFQNWLLYCSYSISNKEPIRDDFKASEEQQPKPEHLSDIEAGLEHKKANSFWSANFYYMKYNEQLVLTGKINSVGAYTRTNIPNSFRTGIELQASSQITKWFKASANLTLSKNKILHFTEYIDNYDNGNQKTNYYSETDISFSPDIISSAIITLNPSKNLSIDFQSKFVGRQFLDNTSNTKRMLSPYFIEDLKAVYSFQKKWMNKISIILQVYNIFNKLYEPGGYTYSYYSNNVLNTQNYYSPMAGTNVMAGLNILIK